MPDPLGTHPARPARLAVSPATRADVSGVIDLVGRVYAEYGFIYDVAREVPDLLDFEAHYGPPDGAFFVVRQDGQIVGSVGVERLDRDRAELHRLYLDAAFRGQGTGRALVEAVLDWCRARAVARLMLWSDTRFEQAHRLYQRMGFRQYGERTLPDDLNQTREYRFERAV
jgi:GNAT superfamily N-acetyltransferase